MKRLPTILFLGISLVVTRIDAQQMPDNRIDSLKQLLQNSKSDAEKKDLYLSLLGEYMNVNYEQGLALEEGALALAAKLKDKLFEATVLQNLGKLYWRLGEFEKARQYHFKARSIYEAEKKYDLVLHLNVDIGQDYADEGNYAKATEYFIQSTEQVKKMNNKSKLSQLLFLQAFVYGQQGNYIASTEKNYEALKICEELKDDYGKAVALSNIAANMGKLGDIEKLIELNKQSILIFQKGNDWINTGSCYIAIADGYMIQKKYDDGEWNLQEAKEIYEKINDKIGIGNACKGLGYLHFIQHQYAEALQFYLLAEKNYKAVSAKQSLAQLYSNLGLCYVKLNQFETAATTLQQIPPMSLELGNKSLQLDYLSAMSVLDSVKGNWKNAYYNFYQYVKMNDSIFNDGNSKKLLEMEVQFDYQKKEAVAKAEQEKKDAVNQKELQKQKLVKNIILGATILTVVLLFFVYRNYKKQIMANKLLYETQQELVKAEKNAAFGEVASRMSHEILNPLNFVNNFSELSREILDELLQSTNEDEKKQSANDLFSNLERINFNGKRAENIVKQLQRMHAEGKVFEFFEG
ncbi:MAG: tetratricopeptide repeat protein [Chitinophagales bacterium]